MKQPKKPPQAQKKPKPSLKLKEPPLPQVIEIEMTPKLYNALKEAQLRQLSPIVRSHIGTYFEWIKSIKPEEVVDGIYKGTTPQQAYKNLGINPLRFGIAAARGFLKIAPKYQNQLKEVATLETALLTLKFENPATYKILESYGERGQQFLETWVHGSLEILGVVSPVK